MRVADLFKRLLGLPGVRVRDLWLEERPGAAVLAVRVCPPARRLMACSGCGQLVRAIYDRSERRVRHRDLLGARCELVVEVRRLSCPACGVRPEALPFLRAGSRFTREFEDTCAWLARHAPQRIVAELMRIDPETVGRIAARVVAEARRGGDGLDGLVRIGVDEVSWRRGHHYLTVVCCHDSGRVVWVGQGDRARALGRFFDQLGPERAARIEAISADLGPAYLSVIRARAPQAAVCADPFHLVQMAHFALDRLRAQSWQRLRRSDPERARFLKGARFALRRGPQRRTASDITLIEELAEANQEVYRAFLWCEQLRALVRGELDPDAAPELLQQLAAAAPALGHPRFRRLGRALSRHAGAILATLHHRITNGRIEALNSTVRLLSHRARGFRRVDNLIGLIHLVCGRVRVELPT
jgi:transposase